MFVNSLIVALVLASPARPAAQAVFGLLPLFCLIWSGGLLLGIDLALGNDPEATKREKDAIMRKVIGEERLEAKDEGRCEGRTA